MPLINTKEIEVQFHEVDSLQIVWHGHYLKYFEIGREAFGKQYGLSYMKVYEQGFLLPVVKINCDYKKPIAYEDEVIVETEFIDVQAAKVVFNYVIKQKRSGEVCAQGNSEQVFLTKDGELHLTIPPFFEEWKKSFGLGNF
jgi:acyl-CoA thioester hydrolase